ncbi:hypothetical protein MRX96_025137 [Rhipicephalus microplus]
MPLSIQSPETCKTAKSVWPSERRLQSADWGHSTTTRAKDAAPFVPAGARRMATDSPAVRRTAFSIFGTVAAPGRVYIRTHALQRVAKT